MSNPTQLLGNLTMQELKQLIRETLQEEGLLPTGRHSYRLAKPDLAVWQSIVENLIPTPEGVPTPTQMLREDRDR